MTYFVPDSFFGFLKAIFWSKMHFVLYVSNQMIGTFDLMGWSLPPFFFVISPFT